MIIYVFPHCKSKEGEIKKIKGISRLFAYPTIPHFDNEGKLVILDSGAYGLSKSGGYINLEYMKNLSSHYQLYARENTLCIAPDVYLDPFRSMKNFKLWHQNGFYKAVVPVLQCDKEKVVDIELLKYQVDFYLNYKVDKICFSNNALMGHVAKVLKIEELFKYIKSKGIRWIHILGAGWSLEDIKNWAKIKYFDSLDSIAYYNSREKKQAFGSQNPVDNIYKILELEGIDV